MISFKQFISESTYSANITDTALQINFDPTNFKFSLRTHKLPLDQFLSSEYLRNGMYVDFQTYMQGLYSKYGVETVHLMYKDIYEEFEQRFWDIYLVNLLNNQSCTLWGVVSVSGDSFCFLPNVNPLDGAYVRELCKTAKGNKIAPSGVPYVDPHQRLVDKYSKMRKRD